MSKRNWRDLTLGTAMIALSIWLLLTGTYTIEIGIILGIMTLLWLIT